MPAVSLLRPRLFEPLDGGGSADGARSGVCLVSAPAGYGKTTLLAAYAQSRRSDVVVAWVSCDRHDNDPAMLWTAVLAAISRGAKRIGGAAGRTAADTFARLVVPQPEMEPAFVAEFIDAVDALPAPLLLVLDDVHELVGTDVTEQLDQLFRNQPDKMTFILGCRYDPALSLPRLRLDGRLCELRARDLAFTTDETAAFFAAHDIDLGSDDLATLHARTEGWPAALRLAAMSLTAEDDPAAFVAAFAGDTHAVADYLVAEVLARRPAADRRFLADVCLPVEVTSDLAVVLSGRRDAGAVLDELARANALVARLGRGPWYRLHGLLRSYLQADLHRRDPAASDRGHARAAGWFAEAGMAAPALQHAAASHDAALVIELLRRFGLRLLLSGGGAIVHDVIGRLAPEVADRTEVVLIAVIAALERSDVNAADRLYERVDGRDLGQDRWLAALRDATQLYRARLAGDTSVLADARYEPRGDRPWSGALVGDDIELLVLANRGALRIAADDAAGARRDLEAGLDLARRGGRDYLALHCLNQLSGAAGVLNDLSAMQTWAEQAIAFAGERGWASSARMAYAYTLAAWAAHLRLDLATADRWAPAARAVLGPSMTPEVEMAARSGEAVVAFDRPPERRDALERLGKLWVDVDASALSPALVAYANMAELRMCLVLGHHRHAQDVVQRAAQLDTQRSLRRYGDANVLRGLLLLSRGRAGDARRCVADMIGGRTEPAALPNKAVAWLVDAVAADRQGQASHAHRALSAALELGRSTGTVRPFYDMGPVVHELLLRAAGRVGSSEDFRQSVLTAWTAAERWQFEAAGVAGDDAVQPTSTTPYEPLTSREFDMLRDLPSMLTIAEIAEAHVLSVNTVKTHLRAIYRKLDVRSRRDAVAVGRALGML